MTAPNRPPLWKVMEEAYDRAPIPPAGNAWDDLGRHFMAAEIRAVAAAIPEELHGAIGVKAWLVEEALRAERGND